MRYYHKTRNVIRCSNVNLMSKKALANMVKKNKNKGVTIKDFKKCSRPMD